jgi:dTDP-4-dehydrorhamnose 3,5-epimerase|tara:strand:- start:1189 stop:1692 length:504 start_codon:yes stop_codon:yes gene_type:complete
MKIKIKSDNKLKEVKCFTPEIFEDHRGKIWTSWDSIYFNKLKFNLDKFTTSKKGVLRGFHGDAKSWKLVTCIQGEILSVVVDYRTKSKNYLKFTSFKINDKNRKSLLIPPMFLNSWLCLSKNCIYSYKYSFQGKYSDVKDQISIKWDDPKINFKWPVKKPILSKRDK